MANEILNSRLRILELNSKLENIKTNNSMSKFSANVKICGGLSKFTKEIKSELDIKIPMEVDLYVMKEGPTKDGKITREELEASIETEWKTPIIDFHDMADLDNPTAHKISDRKGFASSPRLEVIDGDAWVITKGLITDRYLAYLIYLYEKQGEPLEISAEFKRDISLSGGEKSLVNIQPHLISIIDEGEIKGNKIKIKNQL